MLFRDQETSARAQLRLAPPFGLPGLCGVLVLNATGVVIGISQDLSDLIGARTGEPLDMRQPAAARLWQFVQDLAHSGQDRLVRQVALPARNGQHEVSCAVRVFSVSQGQTDPSTVLVIGSDLDAPAFQNTLLQIDRLTSLGTLSASVAHEVRNALVAVKSFIDLLLEKNPNEELASLVRRELVRIETMVTGTLKFAGPGTSQPEAFHLHSVVEHAVSLVSPQIRNRGIQLTQELRAAQDRLCGSSAQLQQACINLFLNAVEAMGNGGVLTVSTCNTDGADPRKGDPVRQPARRIELRVRDSGPGLSADERARLFQPFFTTKPHGTGLGLVITRRIVEEHDGDISVRSSPGEGSTFVLSLPLAATGAVEQAPAG